MCAVVCVYVCGACGVCVCVGGVWCVVCVSVVYEPVVCVCSVCVMWVYVCVCVWGVDVCGVFVCVGVCVRIVGDLETSRMDAPYIYMTLVA